MNVVIKVLRPWVKYSIWYLLQLSGYIEMEINEA